jgi:hypothetical protein
VILYEKISNSEFGIGWPTKWFGTFLGPNYSLITNVHVPMEVSSSRYKSSKETTGENLKISSILYLFWPSGQTWPPSIQTMHIFGISEQFATRKSTIGGQPKILTLLWKFSIFKADARVEDLNILKSWTTKVGCDKDMQLLRPQSFWISHKTQITPP